jgi:hypothetical protein
MDLRIQKRIRAPYRTNVYFSGPNRRPYLGISRNVSLNGIYIETPQRLDVDSTCYIEVLVDPYIKLKIKGKVVRFDKEGLGIHFEEMEHDVFFHLKSIMYDYSQEKDNFLEQCEVRKGFK